MGTRPTAYALAVSMLAASCGQDITSARRPEAVSVSMGASGRVAAPRAVDTMRQAVLDHLSLHSGQVVAEIGLGRGWFVFRAAQAVGPGGTVYATDLDPEALASIGRELPHIDPAAGHVDVRLCRNDRDTALDDVADGTVDSVLMIDSLCFDGRASREPRTSL